MKTGYILFLAIVALTAVRAEALTTRDGNVYHDYKVLSHDAGFLTILDREGGGKIPLSDLPDDLQKKYGYDKAQADAFVQATVQQDRKDRAALTTAQDLEAQKQAAPRAKAASALPDAAKTPTPDSSSSNSEIVTEQKPRPPPITTPPQDGPQPDGPKTNGFSPFYVEPVGVTDEKCQAAMDSVKVRIKEIKELIRQEKMQEAKARSLNSQHVNSQTSVAASGLEQKQVEELAQFREQLIRLRASEPPMAKPTLTANQIADIQEKIKKLSFDMRDLQREMDKDSPSTWNSKTFDYPDVIAEEADQVKKLHDQLSDSAPNGDQVASAQKPASDLTTVTRPLSQKEIKDTQQKIMDLKGDIAFMKKVISGYTDPRTGQLVPGTPLGGFAITIEQETKQVRELRALLVRNHVVLAAGFPDNL
jgi:hypothetical protein